MKADIYFSQNEANAGEAFEAPVATVRRVSAGDSIFVNNFGLPIQTAAEEDGWHLEQAGVSAFYDDEKFAEFVKTNEKVTPEQLGLTRVDLPEGTEFEAVKKGETIVTQPWSDTDLGVEADASEDGYVVVLEGKRRFFSDLEFRSTFNTQAAPQDKSQAFYRAQPDQDAVATRFVVLAEPVTFDFEEGQYTAEAGMVLYENADDVDGYTVVPNNHFRKGFAVTKEAVVQQKPSAGPATPANG